MQFKDYLIRNSFDFDLYGRGFNPIDDKFDALYPYKYSIAMESFSCGDYWTEKIADCYLSWTIPIYWGAWNISKYFPRESMICIDPSQPEKSLKKIRAAIDNDFWGKNLSFLKEARELVLFKYQFFPWIVDEISNTTLSSKKRRYFIPKNDPYRQNKIAILKRAIKKIMKILFIC